MIIRILAPILAVVLYAFPQSAWSEQKQKEADPIYLGVVMFPSSESVEKASSTSPYIAVAFRFDKGKWSGMKQDFSSPDALKTATTHFPASASWTVVLNGKMPATLTSANPKEISTYKDVGSHFITSDLDKIPKKENSGDEFSGWLGPYVYRPLVAVTKPHYQDPESWRPVALKDKLQSRAYEALRKQIPHIYACETREEFSTSKQLKYPDNYIQFMGAYRSKHGKTIVGLRLDYSKDTCGGLPGDEWQEHWFLVEPKKDARFLDHSIHPLGYGDYDNDGRTEWIFWVSRYNRDGYALFHQSFNQRSEFTWNYH